MHRCPFFCALYRKLSVRFYAVIRQAVCTLLCGISAVVITAAAVGVGCTAVGTVISAAV